MQLYFEITDRLSVVTPIEDPIGWDATILTLQRDREKHGVFPVFQNNTFEYTGIAAKLLRAEYEQYGIEGNMSLSMNYECADGIKSLLVGRFSFAQWEDEFGDDCSVRLPVEATSDITTFRNRIDQKVDLQTATAFDGSTALTPYAALPFTETLPGKSILVQNYAINEVDETTIWHGQWQDNLGIQGDPQMAFFTPGFKKTIAGEIGGFEHLTEAIDYYDVAMVFSWTPPIGWEQAPYWDSGFTPFDQFFPFDSLTPIVNYDESKGANFGSITLTLDLVYDKTITPRSILGDLVTNGIRIWNVYLGILPEGADPSDPAQWNWLSDPSGTTPASPWSIHDAHLSPILTSTRATFSHTETITLNPGDRIYYFEKLFYEKKDAYNTQDAFTITSHAGSYFKLSGLSYSADTDSKLFMVNEAWSRIAEAITDDQIRVYSDFYGRTDSEPYTAASDGCGALTSITEGLFVRRMEEKLTDRPPIYSLSINDMWAGLMPIHNIGMGFEPDTARSGYNCLRIEDWRYFYSNDVIMECIGIPKIKRKIQATDHVSKFIFGYDKWEAEQFNGIDEFLTKREYRTELTQASNTLSKLSTFIASGFAIEVTRRLGNTTSEDWRYDKETFVIAMKRSGGALIVQVGDISDADHIIDPATIYNFAIRPTTMALRWLPMVLASYKQATTASKIIFTDGTGNVYAEGWLNAGNCLINNTNALSEKETLTPAHLAVPADGLPAWDLEDISYDFPMTIAQFKAIEANPTGRIYYEGDGLSGYGWIDNINYKPEAGIAEFILIPER